MTDRALFDWRDVELRIGQTVIYGRHVGRSISPTVAIVTGFKVSEIKAKTKAYSNDKVHLKPLDTAFGELPEKEVWVMPERVTVVTEIPTKVVTDG